MKKTLFSLAMFFFSFELFSQSIQTTHLHYLHHFIHNSGDVCISLSGNKMNNSPYESVMAGGFRMRIFMTKNLSLDTDLLIGQDYFHFGPGVVGLPLILLSTDSDPALGFIGLILMLFSAEHVAYHLPFIGTTDISPFVSLLRFKHANIENVSDEMENLYRHTSFVTGIEVNKYFKHFTLSPYFEYNRAYDGYVHGFNFGVNLGYYIPKHK